MQVASSGRHSYARALRTTRTMSSSSSGSIAVEAQPSTCTWNQLDVDGQCVLQPRSCYSCLNTLPTTKELCTLTSDGVCMGADAYDPAKDYRRMGPSSAWPPHLNNFPAANSTYCEDNDAACASCRDKSFKNWQTNPSQYCEGAGGCVCVSICEYDLWEVATQPTLEKVLSAENETFPNCTIEEVASDDSGSSGSLSDFVGLPTTKDVFSSSDECMWYQASPYCGQPRTCYDCLSVPLYSGVKCMLHSSGYCTSMDAYDRTKDFRRSGRSNHSIALFPSTNTTYCMEADETCRQCRSNGTFASWQNVSSPPTFCVGTGGCVCVASCEAPDWSSAVVDLTCDTATVKNLTADESTKYQLSPMAFWAATAISILLSIVCAFVLLRFYRKYQNRRTERNQRRPRSPKGPVLELNGWKSMREKLIETEREFVGETTAPHLERRRHAASQNTPDGAADEELAPVVPTVEEGDAYRPASPSRMHAYSI